LRQHRAPLPAPLTPAVSRHAQDLDHYSNCLWLVLMSMTGIGFGDFYPQTLLGRFASAAAFFWGVLLAAMIVLVAMRATELSESEVRMRDMVKVTASKALMKQRAAFYIQAAWTAYQERLQRTSASLSSSSLLGNEPLHADPKFCRAMRRFRSTRREVAKPDPLTSLIFKEVRKRAFNSRSADHRVCLRLLALCSTCLPSAATLTDNASA
jgi:hypothetical protein